MKYEVNINGEPSEVTLNEDTSTFETGNLSGEYSLIKENGRFLLRVGTKLHRIDNVSYDGSDIEFSIDGGWHKVSVKDEQEILLDKLGFKTGAASADGVLKSPMPGKILDIMVSEGDPVKKDQPLVILEAMKMENELKSPVDGVVARIDAQAGQSLEKNTPILEIDTLG